MGKRRSDLPKNSRHQVIISILEVYAKGDGLTTSEICKFVEGQGISVSSRTILRDLNELSLCCPLSEEGRDGNLRWTWVGTDSRPLSYIDSKWRALFLEKKEQGDDGLCPETPVPFGA